MAKTLDNIRNFCIIAHVDHGKTTLSDRILELTHAVSARELKAQTLAATTAFVVAPQAHCTFD